MNLMNHYLDKIALFIFISYFFASPPSSASLVGAGKKSTPEIASLIGTFRKKRAPKNPPDRFSRAGITSFFREGALIKLLHYCSFNFSSLKTNSDPL